jgi:hypothetical protein
LVDSTDVRERGGSGAYGIAMSFGCDGEEGVLGLSCRGEKWVSMVVDDRSRMNSFDEVVHLDQQEVDSIS